MRARRFLAPAAAVAILAACGGPTTSASPATSGAASTTTAPSARSTPIPASPTPGATVLLPVLGHTATLLLNGTVLVAGGVTNEPETRTPVSSAEIYDPATNHWSTTGAMTEPRTGHVAVLLADGKVLVAGGQNSSSPDGLATTELYDPATGRWASTGDMAASSSWLAAARLGTGDVLAVSQNHAELYDETRGSWSATPRWAADRGNLSTLTALDDGTALVAGGGQREGCAITEADVFDPSRRVWTVTGAMAEGHMDQAAVLLHDGRVLVMGDPCDSDVWAELYDPGTRTWTTTGRMLHTPGSAMTLANGLVVAVGATANEDALAFVERFDPAKGTWAELPSLHTARAGHTATLLPNGMVLVVGGDAFVEAATMELYDPNVAP